MEFTYTPHGVCSRQILLELDGNKVSNVRFIGGCSGNTQGIARLADGCCNDWANMRIFACAAAGLASCFALNHRSPRYTALRK